MFDIVFSPSSVRSLNPNNTNQFTGLIKFTADCFKQSAGRLVTAELQENYFRKHVFPGIFCFQCHGAGIVVCDKQ